MAEHCSLRADAADASGVVRWTSGSTHVLSSPSLGGRAAGDGRGGASRTSLGRASTPWDKGSTRAPTCLREWRPPLTGPCLSLRPSPTWSRLGLTFRSRGGRRPRIEDWTPKSGARRAESKGGVRGSKIGVRRARIEERGSKSEERRAAPEERRPKSGARRAEPEERSPKSGARRAAPEGRGSKSGARRAKSGARRAKSGARRAKSSTRTPEQPKSGRGLPSGKSPRRYGENAR